MENPDHQKRGDGSVLRMGDSGRYGIQVDVGVLDKDDTKIDVKNESSIIEISHHRRSF